MNLQQLKYAVEVEKTHSISRAAENLFMGQPNLSRAVKELEESLGITIFKRTAQGITPTPQGEEFLQYARDILSRIEEVETLYAAKRRSEQRFSLSVPRASYIAEAFTAFCGTLDAQKQYEIYYKETNAMRSINNLLHDDYNLAVLRYQTDFEEYFSHLLYEKGLKATVLCEFSFVALMADDHPLAKKENLTTADLSDFPEIAHGDPYVPSLPAPDVRKAVFSELSERHIFVYERASQFELLERLPGAYMWVSPVPERQLARWKLVQKTCADHGKRYRDVLVHKKEYSLSALDKAFLEQLEITRHATFDKTVSIK